MPTIHPTAIIDRRAELADDVRVEPYAIIGPGVTIGVGTVIESHTVIHGLTAIGAQCKIGPAAHVGLDPQHLGFLAKPDRPQTWLEIGDRTIVREAASLHRSTSAGRERATKIGNDCMIMGGAHIGHDCRLGNNVILANGVLLGGHCEIADRAFLGGGCTLHQFTRVGRLVIISGNEAVSRDIPPFAAARYGGLKGYNAIGCKRAGLTREAIHSIRSAYYCFHTHRTTRGIVAELRKVSPMTPEVEEMIEFMSGSKRGIHPSVKFINYLNMAEE
jgi:UDP-N-acetylglucosamine acyltransferase